MAIDTRDKRASAISSALPWRGLWPLPDGALDQGDRQHVASMYRGIAAGAPAASGGDDGSIAAAIVQLRIKMAR